MTSYFPHTLFESYKLKFESQHFEKRGHPQIIHRSKRCFELYILHRKRTSKTKNHMEITTETKA